MARSYSATSARDAVTSYMQDVSRTVLIDRDEEARLADAAEAGDRSARQQLIVANLRLVIKVAGKYRRYGIPFADLVQEGNIGLIEGVKRYRTSHGTRLSTYAAYWIRAMIMRYVLNNFVLVKIGTTQEQRKLFFKLRAAEAKLTNINGRRPTDQEVADMLDVKASTVRLMRQRMNREVSLDIMTAANDGDAPVRLLDLVADHAPGPDASLDRDLRIDAVSAVIARVLDHEDLNPTERYIMAYRIMADEPETLASIGEKFSLSRERIRQLETRTKEKLRRAMERDGIDEDDADTDPLPFPIPDPGISLQEGLAS